jgi:hypothetical protein
LRFSRFRDNSQLINAWHFSVFSQEEGGELLDYLDSYPDPNPDFVSGTRFTILNYPIRIHNAGFLKRPTQEGGRFYDLG